jgi:O-antigen ligase
MRKITYWLTLVLIFIVPWEDSLSITAIGSLTRLTGLVVAGCWFLTILTEGRFRKPHLFHAFVLFFFLWNIVSYIWSIDIDRTFERIKTYLQIFLLMLIIWELFKEPADLIAGLQAYILGAYVCIASSIGNYLSGTIAENYEVRYSATGVNAVDLSLLLLLGIPLAWHLSLLANRKKNRILKIINFAYIPFAIFTVLLTASRTSLFAVVPAIIFILWPKRFNIGRFILISIFLGVSIMIIRVILPAGIIERLATTSTSISSADFGGRVNLWKEAITLFLGHPLVGSGAGILFTTIGSEAHQTFLSILAETGLIGFLLFTCILAIVINQAAGLPKGYSGLWFSVFFIWVIGVLSLTWEAMKPTWLFMSFVIIEAAALHDQFRSENLKSKAPETKKANSSPVLWNL